MIFSYVVFLFFHIDQDRDISYAETFNEDGNMASLVRQSLSDGSLSISEKYQIYFEKNRQIDLFEKRRENEKLNDFISNTKTTF